MELNRHMAEIADHSRQMALSSVQRRKERQAHVRAVFADVLTVSDRQETEDQQHGDAGHDGCRAHRTESLVV